MVNSKTKRLHTLLPASISCHIVLSCREVKCLPSGEKGSAAVVGLAVSLYVLYSVLIDIHSLFKVIKPVTQKQTHTKK